MSKKKQTELMDDDGSYVVKKNRKLNICAFILCLLVALLIWIYATNLENRRRAEEAVDSAATEVAADVSVAVAL